MPNERQQHEIRRVKIFKNQGTLPVSADIKSHAQGAPLSKENTRPHVDVEKVFFPHMALATGWGQQQPALALLSSALQFSPLCHPFSQTVPWKLVDHSDSCLSQVGCSCHQMTGIHGASHAFQKLWAGLWGYRPSVRLPVPTASFPLHSGLRVWGYSRSPHCS